MMTIPVPVMGCSLGTTVMIVGLTQKPCYNGLIGVVQSFDREKDRYCVKRTSQLQLLVKRENLQMQVPVPKTGVWGTPATALNPHGDRYVIPLSPWRIVYGEQQ